MAKKAASLLVARESFVGGLDGKEYDVRQGDLIEVDHPLARKFKDQFTEPELRFAKIEQATAAPGERRNYLRKPKADKPPQATAAQEAGIAASVKAEAEDKEPEPEPAPEGKALTTSGFKGQ
jgi:pyruvate/2-oxoglutarate dehydrogenase complex dihydrolipoamide acyltransferase (E2) component